MADKEQEGTSSAGYTSLSIPSIRPPSLTYSLEPRYKLLTFLSAAAISPLPNLTSLVWAKSPMPHPKGQGKPNKASVPQGAPLFSSTSSVLLLNAQAETYFYTARQPKTSPAMSPSSAVSSKV